MSVSVCVCVRVQRSVAYRQRERNLVSAATWVASESPSEGHLGFSFLLELAREAAWPCRVCSEAPHSRPRFSAGYPSAEAPDSSSPRWKSSFLRIDRPVGTVPPVGAPAFTTVSGNRVRCYWLLLLARPSSLIWALPSSFPSERPGETLANAGSFLKLPVSRICATAPRVCSNLYYYFPSVGSRIFPFLAPLRIMFKLFLVFSFWLSCSAGLASGHVSDSLLTHDPGAHHELCPPLPPAPVSSPIPTLLRPPTLASLG